MSAIVDKMPKSVTWRDGQLVLLDQTQLPQQIVFETQETLQQVWDSIKALKVRGAPAIGVAAAYGMLVPLKEQQRLSSEKFIEETQKVADFLNTSRPTAVNLSWAVNRMVRCAQEHASESSSAIYQALEAEAIAIHEEDRAICHGIGKHGMPLIKEGMGILTHCNAGGLATSELGTALAPMYLAHEKGVSFRVYADETRPLLQGSRLTAWELSEAGIDTTLICDNMAAHLMSHGKTDLVIVGTDRVAANGDVANKIGTMGVAILAKHFGIPFYVACPSSTIDFATATGKDIPIEERDPGEVTSFGMRSTAPKDIQVRNPAFDVTPHELVTGIITESGIAEAPYLSSLQCLSSVGS